MNNTLLMTAIALMLLGIFSIASSSIGIEVFNLAQKDIDNCAKLVKDKDSNKTFLIVNLVSAILMVIVSFASVYFAFQQ